MRRWDDDREFRSASIDDSSEETRREHEEPREDPFGRGFERHDVGRPLERRHEARYSGPYDRWQPSDYVLYSGAGYHREFIEPYKEPEPGSYAGRGPKNSPRRDSRIEEDINDHLTQDADLDATDVRVQVSGGEVTLQGTVSDRHAKRLAEDIAFGVRGVRDVQNRLRIGTSAETEMSQP